MTQLANSIRLAVGVGGLALAWFAFGDREVKLDGVRLLAPAALGLLGFLPFLIGLERGRPAGGSLGLTLRCAVWTAAVLALSRPELSRERAQVSLVAAIDVSDSIGDASLEQARAQLRALRAHGSESLHVVTFARTSQVLAPGAELVRPEPSGENDESNLEAAVQHAYRLFDPERVPNVLLITDGNQTRGDLAREAERAAAAGVRIDHLVLEPAAGPSDFAVLNLEAPRDLALGVPFKLSARLHAEVAGEAELRLYRTSAPSKLEHQRTVQLPRGTTTVEIGTTIDAPGRVAYRLELQPTAADRWPRNNQALVALDMPGPPRVLIVDSEPQLAAAFADALRERDFSVDVRPPSAAPRRDADLAGYAFVVLSDVPARDLRPDTFSALRRYVEELGGGLLVAGGTQGFGLGGYQGSALERLLPVRSAGEEQRDQASLALAVIIDCSGSMAGGKLELAREAASLTAQTLADSDLIEVIGFSSEPERRVRLQAASNRASIAQSIARLAASGGTQLYPALDAAYKDLRSASARLKHAILLTDGQTQEAGIEDLASSLRADGITLSTVGLGTEVNRSLLETLAGLGGGRAYFPLDARNIPQIFMSEASRHKRPSAIDRSTRIYERERAGFFDGISLGSLPPLGGYVTTQAKPRPAQVLLETERGEPLLARWRVGLGYALAWTSDLKPRWATGLLRWPNFGRWSAQLVREHMRVAEGTRIPLEVRLEGDRARVIADVLGSGDELENGLEGVVSLAGDEGEVASAPLRQTAPARYEAELPMPKLGAFTVHADVRRAGQAIALGHGAVARSYSTEYAFPKPDAALLADASQRTGGRRVSRAAQAFDAGDRRIQLRQELWYSLALLAIVLFLLEQCVRHAPVFGKNPAPGRDGGARSVW